MSSRQYQVLTAVGRDRPGLVEKISSLLLGAGANLEDSRMAILGGEFALILLFSGTDQAVAESCFTRAIAKVNPRSCGSLRRWAVRRLR